MSVLNNLLKSIAQVFMQSDLNTLRRRVLPDLINLTFELYPDYYVTNSRYKHSTVLYTGLNIVAVDYFNQVVLAKKDNTEDLNVSIDHVLEEYPFHKRLSVLYDMFYLPDNQLPKIQNLLFVSYLPDKQYNVVYKAYEQLTNTDLSHPLLYYMLLTNMFYFGNSPVYLTNVGSMPNELSVDILALLSLLFVFDIGHGRVKGQYYSLEPNKVLSPRLAAIPLLARDLYHKAKLNDKIRQSIQTGNEKQFKAILNTLLTFSFYESFTDTQAKQLILILLLNKHLFLSVFEVLFVFTNLIVSGMYDPVMYSLYMLFAPYLRSIIRLVDKDYLIQLLEPYELYWQLLYGYKLYGTGNNNNNANNTGQQFRYQLSIKAILDYMYDELDLPNKVSIPKKSLVGSLKSFMDREPDLKAHTVITETDIEHRPYLQKHIESLKINVLGILDSVIADELNWKQKIVSVPDAMELGTDRLDSVGILTLDITEETIHGNFTLPTKEYKSGSKYLKAKKLFNLLFDTVANTDNTDNTAKIDRFNNDSEIGYNVKLDTIQTVYKALARKHLTEIPIYDVKRLIRLNRILFARSTYTDKLESVLLSVVQNYSSLQSTTDTESIVSVLRHNRLTSVLKGQTSIDDLPKELQLILIWHIVYGLKQTELQVLFKKLLTDRDFMLRQYELWQVFIGLFKLAQVKYQKHKRKIQTFVFRSKRFETEKDLVFGYMLQQLAYKTI